MSEYAFWVHTGLVILSVLSACCIIAAFADPIRTMLSSFFLVFLRPFSIIQERTLTYLRSVKTWMLQQIKDESEREGDGPLYYIIGSVLYSILTAFFILCDYGMIVLTAEGMGLDKASVQLPIDTATLTAATLVTTSLFWGAIFFDLLGVTRLAPWRKSLSITARRIFMGISVFFFASSIFVGISMAYWRGHMILKFVPEAEASLTDTAILDEGGLNLSEGNGVDISAIPAENMTDADLQPIETNTNWIVYASLMGISGLSIASTAFSMVGLVIMAKFVILLAIGICALPLLSVTFFAWLISTLLNLIFNAVERVLDFFVNIGSSILRRFGRQPNDSSNVQSFPTETNNTGRPDDADNKTTQPETGLNTVDPGFNPFSRRQAT